MILFKLINENKLTTSLLWIIQTIILLLLVIFSSVLLLSTNDVYESRSLDNAFKTTAMITDNLSEVHIETILNLLEGYHTVSYIEGNILEEGGMVYSSRLIYDSKNSQQYYYSYKDYGDIFTSVGLIRDQFPYHDQFHYSSLIYVDDSIIAFVINHENLNSLLNSEQGRDFGIGDYLNNLTIRHEDPTLIQELESSLNEISDNLSVIIEKERIKDLGIESFYLSLMIVILFVLLFITFNIQINLQLPFLIKNNQFLNVYLLYGAFSTRVKLNIFSFLALVLLTPSIVVFLFLYNLFDFDMTILIGSIIFFIWIIHSMIFIIKKVFNFFEKGRMIDD